MDTLSQHPDAGWWANGWIDRALRWLLGGLFVLASAHKIMGPAAFAKIIFGYDLFPAVAIRIPGPIDMALSAPAHGAPFRAWDRTCSAAAPQVSDQDWSAAATLRAKVVVGAKSPVRTR